MEILTSGSFVPLENREKIDQLIYTAREIATELSKADGFRNSGQTNHQLGLEVWDGAEYVCRAHEEANIRNLFLSKFLERLREIDKENNIHAKTGVVARPVNTATVQQSAPAVPARPPKLPAKITVPEQPPQTTGQDEYLGMVSADDEPEVPTPSYADECVTGYDPAFEALVERLDNELPEQQQQEAAEVPSEPIIAEPSPPPVADGSSVEETTQIQPTSFEQPVQSDAAGHKGQTEVAVTEKSAEEPDPEPPTAVELNTSNVPAVNEVQPEAAVTVESEQIESIVIAEKEPYNFDGCTVTAVVQLLPEAEGVRKCVVSVRTHDFTPRVAIVDVTTANALPQISGALGIAFEQYRNELPARAADKLKKEKPAAKKQSKSGSKNASAQTKAKNPESTASPSTPPAATEQSQQGLFAS
ncbi:MAG: hypothetical protein KF855_11940 [Acidobacteria bacterium]|nr:hypothetical protein [Acidobacteriota bacterium]